jgi:hypothetical protein
MITQKKIMGGTQPHSNKISWQKFYKNEKDFNIHRVLLKQLLKRKSNYNLQVLF